MLDGIVPVNWQLEKSANRSVLKGSKASRIDPDSFVPLTDRMSARQTREKKSQDGFLLCVVQRANYTQRGVLYCTDCTDCTYLDSKVGTIAEAEIR
jgi:hypothetical protein